MRRGKERREECPASGDDDHERRDLEHGGHLKSCPSRLRTCSQTAATLPGQRRI
jgi:hypothetical protein